MDAWDCPAVREISLQWGTRLGKTFFAQCCLLWTAACDPAPCMHANSKESLCLDVLDRLYTMIGLRPRLEALLAKRPHERRQDLVEFSGCRLMGAWAKSVSSLADKNVKIGHAAETDKWEHATTSREAHPLELFADRFKDYWSTRKIIWESTPTVKGKSAIETRLLGGTHCRLHVPCRRCKRYQTLEWHRVLFDKPQTGRASPGLAQKTARYQCRHCDGILTDADRPWMIRRGVWCPRGCEVEDAIALRHAESRMLQGPAGIAARGDDGAGVIRQVKWGGWHDAPWIRGPLPPDDSEASYQLSSLYALSLTWGDIAKKWVQCFSNPVRLRNFINQWLAETWEARQSKSTAQQLADRLGTELPARLVPRWASYLTLTIDRQAADGGFVVWVVMAHGPDERVAVVAHGISQTLAEVHANVWEADFPAEDGGGPFRCAIAGVDSGWNTKATYAFVNRHPQWFALKGSSGTMDGKLFQIATLKEGSRSGATGQTLIHVNTNAWEEDLDDRLHNPERVKNRVFGPNSLALSKPAAEDVEFLDQILNGVLGESTDAAGNERNTWKKRNQDAPNDYRDAVRYGLCLGRAWLEANDGVYPVRPRSTPAGAKSPSPPPAEPSGYVRKPSRGIRRPAR